MMNTYLKALDWWSSLATRERALIASGSIVALVVVFFIFLWLPEFNYVALARKKIHTNKHLLAWMQSVDKKLLASTADSAVQKDTTPVSLLTSLQDLVAENNLENGLSQLKQISNDSIQIDFKEVEFDKVVSLISRITHDQAVSVEHFGAQAQKKPGIVRSQLVLKIASSS